MLLKYISCEQKKFLYQKWNTIVMICIIVFVPIMVLSLDSFAGEEGYLLCKSKLLQGFYLSQAGYVVLSALYFGQEYQKSTLRTSLLSTPNRFLFLLAKDCCILMWTIILLVMTTTFSIVILHIAFDVDLSIENLIDLLKTLLPAYGSILELVLLTSGIVVVTRSMIVSMAIMVSLILGLGNLLLQYGTVMRYLPVISMMNGFLVEDLPWYPATWEGLVVQGIWCVALLFAEVMLFQRRYVR